MNKKRAVGGIRQLVIIFLSVIIIFLIAFFIWRDGITGKYAYDSGTLKGDANSFTINVGNKTVKVTCDTSIIINGKKCDHGKLNYDVRKYLDSFFSSSTGGGGGGNIPITPPRTAQYIFCGNGIVNSGEVCDDGNTVNCDGCKGDCSRLDKICGDGIKECGEQCEIDSDCVSGESCVNCICVLPTPTPV